jgi:hypothetical protein
LQPDQPQDPVDDVSEYLPDDTGRITVPGADPESAIHTGEQPSTTPEGTEDDVADPKLESQETLPEISQSSPIPAAVKQPVGTDPAEQEVDSSSISGDISPPEVEALKDSEPSPALEDISVPSVSTETLPDSAADRPLEQEVEESAIPETESEETTPSDSSSKESTPNGPQQGFEEASADHPQEMATHEVSIPETGLLPTTTTPLEEPQSQIGDQVPVSTLQAPKKKRKARKKAARKYRPPVRFPTPPRDQSRSSESTERDRALPIAVQVTFTRRGKPDKVSLIPRRKPSLPPELQVSGSGGTYGLITMQDEWFQEIVPDNISILLREGVLWSAAADGELVSEWILAGREIYVLSSYPELSGYISRTRLALSHEHVVLCTSDRLGDVLKSIHETGSPKPTFFDESEGAPEGWVILKGVVPYNPVPHDGVGDILEVLRPAPELEIALEGGLRIQYSIWLAGYPPEIRVSGDPELISEVLIDAQETTRQADGTHVAPGWDLVGPHTVWCAGFSRSYSMEELGEGWAPWDAYSFNTGVARQQEIRNRVAICGPLVCDSFHNTDKSYQVIVPAGNPVLIGSVPGEVFICARRTNLRGAPNVASIPFRAVWALPLHPYLADNKSDRVLLIGSIEPAKTFGTRLQMDRCQREQLRVWYTAILNASRKGLRTDPDTDDNVSLWQDYKRLARRIWRALK